MARTEKPGAKLKILRAAERLFAQQGFDATSVDQVAAAAKVNKALIYYYYKSKDGLREALFAHVQQDLIDFMDRYLAGITDSQRGRLSAQGVEETLRDLARGNLEKFVRDMIDFLEEHRDALKLMLMESFKTTSDYPAIFGFFETIFRDQLSKITAMGGPYAAGGRELIYEFFTGFMPMLTFVVLHDQWARHFRTSENKVKRDFLESYIKTHIMNTRDQNQRKKEASS